MQRAPSGARAGCIAARSLPAQVEVPERGPIWAFTEPGPFWPALWVASEWVGKKIDGWAAAGWAAGWVAGWTTQVG